MKHHVITTLWREVASDLAIPDWQTFINDKSVIVERLEPEVDRVMDEAHLKFWVTREYAPASAGAWSEEETRSGLNRTYRLILQGDDPIPPDLVPRLKRLPAVQSAHELTVGEAPLPAPQLSTEASVSRAADLINLAYAKAMTRGDPEIRIGVLDTGVNLDHPELSGKIVGRADFVDLEGLDTTDFIGDLKDWDDVPEDEVGHGTHVSGIIAGRGLKMDEGVAPNCSIVAIRVLATMRQGSKLYGAGIVDNINPAIKWAVDVGRVHVLNASLGIKALPGGGLPHADVIRYAISRDVTVVAASGNDGKPERYYPGALPGVIAVGAVDDQGSVTPFTSYGANIFCVAPGTNVYSSFARRTYAVASGTSQASPFVAGSIGLLKSFARQQGGSLSNNQIASIIRNTSDKVDSRLRNEHAGYGLINLADAFKYLVHSLN